MTLIEQLKDVTFVNNVTIKFFVWNKEGYVSGVNGPVLESLEVQTKMSGLEVYRYITTKTVDLMNKLGSGVDYKIPNDLLNEIDSNGNIRVMKVIIKNNPSDILKDGYSIKSLTDPRVIIAGEAEQIFRTKYK